MASAPGLSLVVLAAGLGTRFGGLKQLEPVGPRGETLLDYTVHDAMRAGFKRVVFVIRQGMVRDFHPFASRFRGPLEIKLAFQHLEDAPPGVNIRARRAPWGTAHAVLAAAPHVSGTFAVVNADDFYGHEAFREAAAFLQRRPGGRVTWGLVGYPLDETLSASGPVNRAVCRVDADGWLLDLVERRVDGSDAGRGDVVSMNFWCFTQDLFTLLREGFDEFAPRAGPEHEYLLPNAVRQALQAGLARVKVLRADSRWLGLTHPSDVAGVSAALRNLAGTGAYPDPLWR
ncbi:MAG TPA: NTP transferase domain-containing protein [Gemmatimonadales bacterium]|nr:NTP transferase domain-containing protein [Gemmatimonadales bacterium]